MISIVTITPILGDTLSTVTQQAYFSWQDILSVLAAVFSALLVIAAWITYMEHNRPYITLNAETGDEGDVYMVLKNSGNRAAYNVRVATDIPLESVYFSKMPASRVPLVTEKNHPFIGPDQKVLGRFDKLTWRYSRRDEDYKEPCDKYSVTIRYKHKIRKFKDTYQLDLSYLEFVPCGFTIDHLERISHTLHQMADNMPGGMAYRLRNWHNNAKRKLKKDDDGMVGNDNSKREDTKNE